METIAIAFVGRAMRGAEHLPAAERADHLDFAASILDRHHCQEHAKAARDAAHALREAEAAQGTFIGLLAAS